MDQSYDPSRRACLRRVSALAVPPAWAGCGGGGSAPASEPWAPIAMTDGDPQPVVVASANGRALSLAIDCGADGTVLDLAAARALGLTLSADTVPGSGGAGDNGEIRWAVLDRLAVGAAQKRRERIYVMAFPKEFIWDGVLGADFLRDFGMLLDFQQRQVVLAPAGQLVAPEGSVRLPLQELPSGKLLVEASVAGVDGWMSLDSGAGNALTLFRPAVDRLDLRNRWAPTVRMTTGVTTGGPSFADVARADMFELGPFRLERPIVELSLASAGLFASSAWLGNIGCEVLRRFTVGIDISARSLWLLPNDRYASAFRGPMAGMTYRDTGLALQVIEVLPAGPADAAGVRLGDRLDAVNGQALGTGRSAVLRSALRGEPGDAVRLKTQSGESRLVLRELV